MLTILKMYAELCLLRRAPQDLPYSNPLLMSTLLLYVVISAMISSLALSIGPALLSGVVDAITLVVVTRLALWVRDKGERLLKTVMALAGSNIIITVIAAPLLVIQQDASPESPAILSAFGLIMLMGWNLGVVAHILRHALALPFWGGFVVALCYMYISMSIMRTLFIPDAPL